MKLLMASLLIIWKQYLTILIASAIVEPHSLQAMLTSCGSCQTWSLDYVFYN